MSEYSIRYGQVNEKDIRGRLIRNPQYGGPSVGLNGWRWQPGISNHTKPQFQAALNESIEQDGIRNPVLVWSLPEGIFLTFGGSRVKAARAIGLEHVPAIINDYTGDYHECPEVTPDNWQGFFTDVPRTFEFTEDGADYHYHLERARRHAHDEAGLAWIGEDASFLATEFPWISSSTKNKQS